MVVKTVPSHFFGRACGGTFVKRAHFVTNDQKREEDFQKIETLIKEKGMSAIDATLSIGRQRNFYYDLKSKRKRALEKTQTSLPIHTTKKTRKKTEPKLVTINMPPLAVDKIIAKTVEKKKPVSIMIGDPDEIMRILEAAKQ